MKLYILTAEPCNFVPEQLQRAAQELNHEVVIVDIARTVLTERSTYAESRAYIKYYEKPPEEEGPLPAAAEPKEHEPPKALAIEPPCVIIPRLNEYGLEYKLGLFNRLSDHGAIMLNTPESMALCNDKLSSQVTLNSSGFRTPYSVAVGSVDLLDNAIKQIEDDGCLKFPMIIKTLRGTHGIGVMKVDSLSSLKSVAQALMSEGQEIMLQEFIEHEESARLIMLGDEMLAANKRKQPKDKDEFRTNSHLGSETEKYEPSEDELAMGRRIVELFGCRFCAIDYIIKGEHNLIVLEVNGSPGLEAIQKDWEGERDLAKMVIKYCATLMNETVADPTMTPSKPPEEEHHEPGAEAEIAAGSSTPGSPLTDIEPMTIVRLSQEPLMARVDTGAKYCSLHADSVEEENDWVKFKRGDITYKVPFTRRIKIRNAVGKHHRPIVTLDVEIRGKRYSRVEFTITSRSDMKYEALIGRNLLELLGLPVIVYNTDGTTATAKVAQDEEE